MSEQVTTRFVTFAHPFQLRNMSIPHAAGTYELRVEKIPIDVSWEAYRTNYTLLLRSQGSTSAWELGADELEELLSVDRAHGINTGHS
jgi:hypothetical protein